MRPFHKHREKSRVFVESGTYAGDGVQAALESGFEQIHSYEVVPSFHHNARIKFQNFPQVHLHLKSSTQMGSEIYGINEPITFWLDGHYSGGDTSYEEKYCPLLEELEVIRQHPRKDHIIMIDDIRLLGTESFNNVTMEQIKKSILGINPLYIFSYENGHEKDDILVAVVL